MTSSPGVVPSFTCFLTWTTLSRINLLSSMLTTSVCNIVEMYCRGGSFSSTGDPESILNWLNHCCFLSLSQMPFSLPTGADFLLVMILTIFHGDLCICSGYQLISFQSRFVCALLWVVHDQRQLINFLPGIFLHLAFRHSEKCLWCSEPICLH